MLAACATSVVPRDSLPRGTASADDPTVLAADVLTYRGDAARSGQMPGPGPTKRAVIHWTFDAGGPIQSQAVVRSGCVYLVSTDGVLHALDLATGLERWRVTLGARSYSSPTIAGVLILVGADDGMHALRIDDGTPAWTTATTGPVRGTAAVVDDLAISVSTTGQVSALDVHSGTPRWTRQVESGGDTSVAAANGLAVFGLEDGTVVALGVEDGSERWRTDIGDGGRVGTPTIADDKVFVVTLDGGTAHHVASLDLATGHIAWRVPSPNDEAAYSPAVHNGLAIVGSEDASVTAMDASSGAVEWHVSAPGVVEVVTALAGDSIYSGSNGGIAFALDAATGTERWQIPIEGIPYGVAVTSGLVLVGTSAGTLYAIGEAVP